MVPTSYFGQAILSVLDQMRDDETVVEYAKIEGDEFLKLPEKGFYLHSKNGNGTIFDCRIYLRKDEEFFPADAEPLGKFASVDTVSDVEEILGKSTRSLRSISIPTRPPTLPGREFSDGKYTVKVFVNMMVRFGICISIKPT